MLNVVVDYILWGLTKAIQTIIPYTCIVKPKNEECRIGLILKIISCNKTTAAKTLSYVRLHKLGLQIF